MSQSEAPNEALRLEKLAESRALDPATPALLEGFADLASEIAGCPQAWISFATADLEVVCSAFGITPRPIKREGTLLARIVQTALPVAMNFPTGELPIDGESAIAYCAGFPLLTVDGLVLGGLFVAHDRPQTLSLSQQKGLVTLSTLVVRLLDLNRGLLNARAELEDRANEGERLARAVGKLQDMTIAREVREAELSEQNAQLQTMAETDGLTSLRNYRSLNEQMVRLSQSGQPIAFLLIDIDWFKHFNDAYGHVAGDETLRTVASLIAANPTEGSVVARYGGEEFAIVLPASDAKQALEYGEALRQRIERHPWPHRPITVCIGVAIRTPEVHTVEDLIRRADAALYAAKRTGKNRVLAWSPS